MSAMLLKLAAREAGEMFFSTGKPCKYGHWAKRYTSTGGCVECLTPGRGARALSAEQALVFKKLSFYMLLPVAATDFDVTALKHYLARCMMQWESATGTIHAGVNQWQGKISGGVPW